MNEMGTVNNDYVFCKRGRPYFDTQSLSILVSNDPRRLDAVDLNRFKAILLDIDMSKRSGSEILTSIRNKNDRVITIIVSRHCDINMRIVSLEQGADYFLARPVDLKELLLITKKSFRAGKRLRQSRSGVSSFPHRPRSGLT